MSPRRDNQPNKLWPFGSKVTLVDAWGFNPVDGKVIGHYNAFDVLVEDSRGVRYFSQTWRITSALPSAGMFDDLLGDIEPVRLPVKKSYDFEDLLS